MSQLGHLALGDTLRGSSRAHERTKRKGWRRLSYLGAVSSYPEGILVARELWSGFKQGLREGPVMFFLPLIAAWRLMSRETAAVMAELEAKGELRRSRPDIRRP